MDNSFTSVDVAEEILQAPYKLMLVGSIHKNMIEIPSDMLEICGRTPANFYVLF